ncbi:MAG: flavin reductase family protein [Balneolaceae bacterium]|nr:flavin reductase family protein [Balneolaceae bacterium]
MKHYSQTIIKEMPSRARAHFINSVTGYKSSNLIGTISPDGKTNLAIFSSVTHLGSNPPLLGFVLRPHTVMRNTFDNLKETGVFTVNHVSADMIRKAHQTSAKYPAGVSEFEQTGLNEDYRDDFKAPYVAESVIKIGCRYVNEYYLKENDCRFIIGAMEHIYLPEELVSDDGFINLEQAGTVSATGLDGYALPKILDRFSYAKPDEEVKSLLG